MGGSQPRKDRGGEEMENPPSPEQPGRKVTMAETAIRKLGRGRRSRRAHSVARWQATEMRRTCQGIPPSPTAPGPSRARSCAASTAYWLRQGRRLTLTTQGAPVVRSAIGPQRTRTRRSRRRRRGKKPSSTRSPHVARVKPETRRGGFLNVLAHLTCAAAKGGTEEVGGTQQCTAGYQGGTPPPPPGRTIIINTPSLKH